ncbi:hypothetical protein LZ32DRAFT_616126 [Colletotrichum eremochloae]|nr:hypothetical protein LZ32DRAFT_616126 [Colletotrichum eremochloae]
MAASSQQNGNADAASNAAEQGSAYSGNPHVPNMAQQNSVETHARLVLFLADPDLHVFSSDHAGTVEHHDSRSRRVFGALTAVDQLLPKVKGNGPADSQADDNPPMDLKGTGAQFDK